MNQLFLIILLLIALAVAIGFFLAERRYRSNEEYHYKLQSEIFRFLLKHGKMGIWHYWPKDKRFLPEKDWFSMVGCEPQQCSNFREQFYQHIDPSDRDRVAQSFDHFIDQQSPIYHEVYSLNTIHRGVVWIEEFGHILTRNDEGEPIEFIGVSRDITEEQLGVSDRLRREAMLQAVASGLKVEFWNWNIVRDQLFIDPLFSELPEHQIGNRYTSREFFGDIFPEDRDGFETALKDFLSGKSGILKFEFRRKKLLKKVAEDKNKSNEWEWLKILAVVYTRDGLGKPLLVAGMSLDVDENVKTVVHLQEDELKLKALGLELKSKEEELNHLSHSLLHSVSSLGKEVRSPLNVTLGIVENLRNKETNTENIAMFDKLKDSSKLIFKIVNEMVDIMKLQSQEFHLEILPFDFKKLMTSIFRSGNDVLSFQGDEHFNYAENILPNIYGDSKRLKQILKDCRNFLQAGDESAKIDVRLELIYLDGLPFLGLQLTNESSAQKILDAQTAVSDFNLPERKSNDFDRTIGLSIADKMIKLMEGSISFERSTQVGNQIKIVLPYRPYNAEPQTLKPLEIKREKLKRLDLSVLVVDDSEANRELMRIYLSDYPINIVMAKDGAEAVQIYQRDTIDLILMDIQMPIMDGREAIQIIRNIEKASNLKAVPIIALSAFVMHEEIDLCLHVGSSSVLLKPVKKGVLLDEMAKLL